MEAEVVLIEIYGFLRFFVALDLHVVSGSASCLRFKNLCDLSMTEKPCALWTTFTPD